MIPLTEAFTFGFGEGVAGNSDGGKGKELPGSKGGRTPPGIFVNVASKGVAGENLVSVASKGVISPVFATYARGACKCCF